MEDNARVTDAQLRKLAEAATQGPWTELVLDRIGMAEGPARFVKAGVATVCKINGPAIVIPDPFPANNAAYIAGANPVTILGLLERIADLRDLIECARDDTDHPRIEKLLREGLEEDQKLGGTER